MIKPSLRIIAAVGSVRHAVANRATLTTSVHIGKVLLSVALLVVLVSSLVVVSTTAVAARCKDDGLSFDKDCRELEPYEPEEEWTPTPVPPDQSLISRVRVSPSHSDQWGTILIVTGERFEASSQVEVSRHVGGSSVLPSVTTLYVKPTELMVRVPHSTDVLCSSIVVRVTQPKESNRESVSMPCPANVLSVLSYNVKLLPPQDVPIFGCVGGCDTHWRRDALVRYSYVWRGYDVVIFQEMFSDSHRNDVISAMTEYYPYRTQVVSSDKGVEQDGGVIILSRWPIENCEEASVCGQYHTFGVCNESFAGNWDCQADKGLLYARVNKAGQIYHVLGTHLDAGSGDGDRKARAQQLSLIRWFVDRLGIPGNEPVIIGGDFNVNRKAGNSEFDLLLDTLDVTFPEHRLGLDQTSVGSDAYFDYVFYFNEYLQPTSASNEVSPVVLPNTRGQHLSDHHPVTGKFLFN